MKRQTTAILSVLLSCSALAPACHSTPQANEARPAERAPIETQRESETSTAGTAEPEPEPAARPPVRQAAAAVEDGLTANAEFRAASQSLLAKYTTLRDAGKLESGSVLLLPPLYSPGYPNTTERKLSSRASERVVAALARELEPQSTMFHGDKLDAELRQESYQSPCDYRDASSAIALAREYGAGFVVWGELRLETGRGFQKSILLRLNGQRPFERAADFQSAEIVFERGGATDGAFDLLMDDYRAESQIAFGDDSRCRSVSLDDPMRDDLFLRDVRRAVRSLLPRVLPAGVEQDGRGLWLLQPRAQGVAKPNELDDYLRGVLHEELPNAYADTDVARLAEALSVPANCMSFDTCDSQQAALLGIDGVLELTYAFDKSASRLSLSLRHDGADQKPRTAPLRLSLSRTQTLVEARVRAPGARSIPKYEPSEHEFLSRIVEREAQRAIVASAEALRARQEHGPCRVLVLPTETAGTLAVGELLRNAYMDLTREYARVLELAGEQGVAVLNAKDEPSGKFAVTLPALGQRFVNYATAHHFVIEVLPVKVREERVYDYAKELQRRLTDSVVETSGLSLVAPDLGLVDGLLNERLRSGGEVEFLMPDRTFALSTEITFLGDVATVRARLIDLHGDPIARAKETSSSTRIGKCAAEALRRALPPGSEDEGRARVERLMKRLAESLPAGAVSTREAGASK